MAQSEQIEGEISELTNIDGISNVVAVSRSGMHIAGSLPEGAHLETFVAMAAILLGAAETATSELKDELSEILINLQNITLIVNSAGPKALLVVRIEDNSKISDILPSIKKVAEKIREMI